MADALHSIRAVARLTGLSAHVIRIWEKRYGAVKPERTDTNRRLYSDEQVERLSLLRAVTQAGQSLGPTAKLSTDQLRQLAASLPPSAPAGSSQLEADNPVLNECIVSVKTLDSRRMEEALKRGAIEFGSQGLLQRVIAPLAQTIGELWRDGVITAAHEHFASAVIRIFLGHAAKPFAAADNAPVIVVATPTGQLHELGAMLAAAAAANLGWHVTYLGASLPAAEIVGATEQNRARAVALSLVYPEDDPRVETELTRLRELLPPDVMVLVGGRAAPAYRAALAQVNALHVKDLNHFCTLLDDLRKSGRKPKP